MIELGHVTDRKPPFRYAAYQRVGFSETDAQGVVDDGRYMPYFDLARTEYHRHLGRVHIGDVDFAMRAVNVDYVAGARFDDPLEIFVRVERIGTTSITYDHAAYRIDDDGDTLMATAKAVVVCIALARAQGGAGARRLPPTDRRIRGSGPAVGRGAPPTRSAWAERAGQPPTSPLASVLRERRGFRYPPVEVPRSKSPRSLDRGNAKTSVR